MRKKIIAGNWKMNLDRSSGINLVDDIIHELVLSDDKEVILAPSFIHLYKAAKMCLNIPNLHVAAQDCSMHEVGAFTGEVSANMILSCGARYIIIGHSERRSNFHETNNTLRIKVKQALSNDLGVIFCCGETLETREKKLHFEWIRKQISDSLFDLNVSDFSKVVIAYEPIWAIGTGVTASPDQAQQIHSFIRGMIADKYGQDVSENTSIIYGGSCKPSNALELFSRKDIDGGLIGGASLHADEFIKIINSI